jgi:hypothetical protein
MTPERYTGAKLALYILERFPCPPPAETVKNTQPLASGAARPKTSGWASYETPAFSHGVASLTIVCVFNDCPRAPPKAGLLICLKGFQQTFQE